VDETPDLLAGDQRTWSSARSTTELKFGRSGAGARHTVEVSIVNSVASDAQRYAWPRRMCGYRRVFGGLGGRRGPGDHWRLMGTIDTSYEGEFWKHVQVRSLGFGGPPRGVRSSTSMATQTASGCRQSETGSMIGARSGWRSIRLVRYVSTT